MLAEIVMSDSFLHFTPVHLSETAVWPGRTFFRTSGIAYGSQHDSLATC